ncbi:PfkB family carbohydrate kinase [Rhodothermus profundi]|uniref:Sugar or nucleoside kinase, ribokinase family n=1 Tax=Rhodothermus profundi TaxID=633813 RepID=A0A1M6P640_9BACT|nr:PfkB family carbohydrate kinase [Rhodothermus profundi]SHK03437.1 Sugar or nucleoside kinase, ribokinase family [Rhodothermus profundi]
MSILVVGTVALDSVETPFGAAHRLLGGSATYIALAASYFWADVRLVAVVGRDFPAAYRQVLQRAGIDLEGLRLNEEEDTFAWGGRYHYDLNDRDTLYTHLNALASFDPVLPATYRNSQIICLGNLDPRLQQRVLDQVSSPAFVICDTMNYWIEHTPEALHAVLRRVDCLVVNDAEARQLAAEPNLIRAARKIQTMGPRIVIIKKGEHGALLFFEEAIFSAPAYPLEDVFDPTGAGDTFAGAMAGFLATQRRFDEAALRQAVVYGSALASFVVERFGPERLLALTPEEIAQRVAALRQLTAFPECDLRPLLVQSGLNHAT